MSQPLATAVVAGVLPAVMGTAPPPPPMVSISQNSPVGGSLPLPLNPPNNAPRPGVMASPNPVSADGSRLAFRSKNGAEVAHTFVRNETDQKQTVTLELILQHPDGNHLQPSFTQ